MRDAGSRSKDGSRLTERDGATANLAGDCCKSARTPTSNLSPCHLWACSECLKRDFCSSLLSSPAPSAARGHAQNRIPKAASGFVCKGSRGGRRRGVLAPLRGADLSVMLANATRHKSFRKRSGFDKVGYTAHFLTGGRNGCPVLRDVLFLRHRSSLRGVRWKGDGRR